MSERLQISVKDHVARVTLNRPGKHNAVDMQTFDELGSIGERLASEPAVRAVVLNGAGENFCAGIDTSIFTDAGGTIDPASMAPVDGSLANRFQRAAIAWRELEVPVICAIHGVAYGAGVQIALGADLRYASPDAKLSIMEIRWGIIPDLGISVTARNLMRWDRLRELAYSGRIVDGREASEIGLVTEVHDDPLAAAQVTAAAIARRSPDAIRAMKRMFNECQELDSRSSLALEAELQMRVMSGPNQLEAVRANVAGREPDFRD
jgi:enoyl-CoA hydratase/carnithine racemase